MARHYGIPYMGSKQKLVDKIVPFILKRHPNADGFYDLFGGGGSVSLYMARKYPKIKTVYNERSEAISSLMQRLKDGGDIPFDFVTRAQFEAGYVGNDWHAGLLQCAWTFGNDQKSYLYGLPLQEFKEKLAMLVMTGAGDIGWLERTADEINKKEYGKVTHTKIFINPKRYKTPYQRRIIVSRQIPGLGALQHMPCLERLLDIERMPGIKNLIIAAGKSYDEVTIDSANPIIYCDPPYEGTKEYRGGGFNHKAFYDWCMAQRVPVYVSSYNVSDPRLKRVKAINTRSLLNSSKSKQSVYNYENIYWNGIG
jgi:hypothetical protein